MMKKILFPLFAFFLLIHNQDVMSQTEFDVDGVIVPRTIDFQSRNLELNGFGTRSKMFVEVYVQALYLSKLSQDPVEIIESDTEMAIRIQITSSMVSSNKLTKNLHNGLEKSTGGDLEKFKSQIETLKTLLSDKIVENDVFNLIYSPIESSIWLYKNNQLKGKIPGFDFKKAFFGIWLSDKPVDDDLKNDLLGKTK